MWQGPASAPSQDFSIRGLCRMWLAKSCFRSAPQCPMGPFPAQQLHAWTIPTGEEKDSGVPWLPAISMATICGLAPCLVQTRHPNHIFFPWQGSPSSIKVILSSLDPFLLILVSNEAVGCRSELAGVSACPANSCTFQASSMATFLFFRP